MKRHGTHGRAKELNLKWLINAHWGDEVACGRRCRRCASSPSMRNLWLVLGELCAACSSHKICHHHSQNQAANHDRALVLQRPERQRQSWELPGHGRRSLAGICLLLGSSFIAFGQKCLPGWGGRSLLVSHCSRGRPKRPDQLEFQRPRGHVVWSLHLQEVVDGDGGQRAQVAFLVLVLQACVRCHGLRPCIGRQLQDVFETYRLCALKAPDVAIIVHFHYKVHGLYHGCAHWGWVSQ
mmetsp:Transcript_86450/g.252981  ORF Transcript_86450/g.252981 Transcript_86450/m.252981 type:complete len:238 (-) Transcript_86450:22-735(-)